MKPREKIFSGILILLTLCGVVLQVIPGMRFSGRLCLALALLCIARWALKHYVSGRAGKICTRIFDGVMISGLFLFAILEGCIVRYGHENWSALPADAVIILGAGVNDETPSMALQSRLNAAYEYLEEYPDIPVILSGGQGPGETITEAEAMRRYLAARGIDEKRLLPETRSTSTTENFRFSKEMLNTYGIDAESVQIAVITNDFHMFRAAMIAQRLNLHILGIPAELPWWLSANYHIREAFAVAKTLVFG